ncbi:MAG: NAD(P)/FAD-dependent oxidoreductase [Lachnospiraceae bacterium]|nr:NAD(P)/FAD-dependent oxidoreductase [Lachnospiraceae bacterium]
MSKKVVIIGGGASGLMAAITAAKRGAFVTLFEHKDRVGKKLLMTGNGKCNLTNMSDIHGKYYGNDLDMIYKILEQFPADAVRAFFQEIGLYTKVKRDGGVYPVSEQATSVLDVLRTECEHCNINILTDTEILEIIPNQNGGMVVAQKAIKEEKAVAKMKKGTGSKKTSVKSVVVGTKEIKLSYDNLIIATGGQAAAVSGSDGSGYRMAKRLGHSLIKPLPALVQLQCEGDYFKMIAGVRAQTSLKLYIRNELCASEEGELQLTDYGISGIPVFQFSRIVARAIYEQQIGGFKEEQYPIVVKIDFLPYLSEKDRKELYKAREQFSYKTVEEFLSGMVNKKIASLVCNKILLGNTAKLKEISDAELAACIDCLKCFPVIVNGTNSYDNAQVCSGGVPLSEIKDSMESKKYPHIYFAGEILDCDGICGGYNLQWAWTTGKLAGEHAALE